MTGCCWLNEDPPWENICEWAIVLFGAVECVSAIHIGMASMLRKWASLSALYISSTKDHLNIVTAQLGGTHQVRQTYFSFYLRVCFKGLCYSFPSKLLVSVQNACSFLVNGLSNYLSDLWWKELLNKLCIIMTFSEVVRSIIHVKLPHEFFTRKTLDKHSRRGNSIHRDSKVIEVLK